MSLQQVLREFNKLLPLCLIEVRSASAISKSFPVSNYDKKFFELNENLRKLNETLNKDDTVLRQHNLIPAKQNETTKVLNTSENNLDYRIFSYFKSILKKSRQFFY